MVSVSLYTLQYGTQLLLRCSLPAQEFGQLLLEFGTYLSGRFMGGGALKIIAMNFKITPKQPQAFKKVTQFL